MKNKNILRATVLLVSLFLLNSTSWKAVKRQKMTIIFKCTPKLMISNFYIRVGIQNLCVCWLPNPLPQTLHTRTHARTHKLGGGGYLHLHTCPWHFKPLLLLIRKCYVFNMLLTFVRYRITFLEHIGCWTLCLYTHSSNDVVHVSSIHCKIFTPHPPHHSYYSKGGQKLNIR
jgi:hypothetical protein